MKGLFFSFEIIICWLVNSPYHRHVEQRTTSIIESEQHYLINVLIIFKPLLLTGVHSGHVRVSTVRVISVIID